MLDIIKVNKKLCFTLVFVLASCSGKDYQEKDFVGKWRTTRLETPMDIYPNNEWEIKDKDGTALQYGIWVYKDKKITWSYKMGGSNEHDVNPVLSMSEKEFQVREADKSITTFYRLE